MNMSDVHVELTLVTSKSNLKKDEEDDDDPPPIPRSTRK